MTEVTRRGFIAGAAALAAPFSAPLDADAQPPKKRDLLTTAWPADLVAAKLVPRPRFHPLPTVAEREAWTNPPADARAALVDAGERQLKTPWEVLPATVFLEFRRNGKRSRFESIRDRRRKKLQDLVMAECLEGKGRFADEIANGVWLTCEETFWGVPAHLGAQKAGVGLPDVTEPIVDLFAAETASLLAWTWYLAGDSLARVSPLVPERIRLEIDRRVLTPCLTRDNFSWMGFSGGPPNNWNPWICPNWLTSALVMERDEARRQAAVSKILRCLDNFLNGYADDGGCDEGPGYWGRAGDSFSIAWSFWTRPPAGLATGFGFRWSARSPCTFAGLTSTTSGTPISRMPRRASTPMATWCTVRQAARRLRHDGPRRVRRLPAR